MSSGSEQGEEMAGEGEVAEIVAAKLQLETVAGDLALRRSHDAGVVDQEIDRPALTVQRLAQARHALQRREIEVAGGELGARDLGGDLGDRILALRAVADSHDHLRAS